VLNEVFMVVRGMWRFFRFPRNNTRFYHRRASGRRGHRPARAGARGARGLKIQSATPHPAAPPNPGPRYLGWARRLASHPPPHTHPTPPAPGRGRSASEPRLGLEAERGRRLARRPAWRCGRRPAERPWGRRRRSGLIGMREGSPEVAEKPGQPPIANISDDSGANISDDSVRLGRCYM
jgi:hypothetical protein